MEVQLSPETQYKLDALVAQIGRDTAEIIEDAMAGYLNEAAQARVLLDGRYDTLKSGIRTAHSRRRGGSLFPSQGRHAPPQ